MNNEVVYGNKVQVTCTHNDKVVEAEIDNFQFQKSLIAFIATNKIPMQWNGSVYVGNKLGMEFTTPGPDESVTIRGRR
mgnify:CR=1 FL=1|tara:strand:+ start:828 stop:1061 length:234 start_codon:yes stop_codon:yes gene_type:complete